MGSTGLLFCLLYNYLQSIAFVETAWLNDRLKNMQSSCYVEEMTEIGGSTRFAKNRKLSNDDL